MVASGRSKQLQGASGEHGICTSVLCNAANSQPLQVMLRVWADAQEAEAWPHLGDDDAVDGRRSLVGAVRAPKLLDGFVC